MKTTHTHTPICDEFENKSTIIQPFFRNASQRISEKAFINTYMTNDKVTPFIQPLCQMDRFSGRCIRLDSSTWEVHDVQQWTEDQSTRLRCQFPSIEARIVTNRKSLSGFSVLLTLQRVSQAWAALLVTAIIVAANAALAASVINMRKP